MNQHKIIFIAMLCVIPVMVFSQTSPKDSVAMHVDLDDIVVTAQYAPTDSKKAVHNIRTISRATIEQRGATNLEQLLQQDPNIRIQQDLILGSRMSLLGIDGENVKIMIDGVPVAGRLDGNIDLSQINLNNVERVEIVEGPMSVSYGSDALAGVINLITKSSQLNKYELGLSQQVATRGEQNAIARIGVRVKNNVLLQFQGGRDWFNGIGKDSQRSKTWDPKEQWYGSGLLRYDFAKDNQLRLRAALFDEEISNAGDIRRPNFKPYAFDDFYYTKRLDFGLAHEGSIKNNFYTQTTLGYNRFRRQKNTYRLDIEPDTISLVPSQQDTTRLNAITARAVIASKFPDFPLNFQLGTDLRYEEIQGDRIVDETNAQPGASDFKDYAFFTSLRYLPFPNFVTEVGLRVAHNSRYQAPLIPSFHLKYEWKNSLTLRASYAEGFRSPSLKELFHYFVDINHYIIGNPNLEAEKSKNIQVAMEIRQTIRDHQFKWTSRAFYNDINNKIDLFEFVEQDGQISPAIDTTTNRFAYFNQSQYKTQGIQLQMDYLWKALKFNAGWSFIGYYNPLHTQFSTVERFTYTNEIQLGIGYTVPVTNLVFSSFFRVNDRLISYFPTTVDGETIPQQREQAGFILLDMTVSNKLWKDRINLTGGVYNLLNIRQTAITNGNSTAHGGGNNSPVSPGRNYFLRLSLDLFWNKI